MDKRDRSNNGPPSSLNGPAKRNKLRSADRQRASRHDRTQHTTQPFALASDDMRDRLAAALEFAAEFGIERECPSSDEKRNAQIEALGEEHDQILKNFAQEGSWQ